MEKDLLFIVLNKCPSIRKSQTFITETGATFSPLHSFRTMATACQVLEFFDDQRGSTL